uniref:SCP domain-containing protein n=1 Tax=Steinernema glaseri TaxID=37863 RepID=A0A1I7YK22_9BILA
MKAAFIYGILLVSTIYGQDCPTKNGISPASRKAIVDKHNAYRSSNALGKEIDGSTGKSAPKAKNMYKMSYDCELEKIAQAWADGCEFKHSPQKSREAGENLYMSWPTVQNDGPLLSAPDSWWKELKDFGVGAFSPKFNFTEEVFSKGVGHYTQMAWARTTKIGCGHAKCPNMNLIVCNYREQGNYLNEFIYEIGNPCQKDADCTTFPKSRCSAKEGLCYQG